MRLASSEQDEDHSADRAITPILPADGDARYHTLFDSIDEGFSIIQMMFNADGAPVDFRFLEANPAFERQSSLRGVTGRLMTEFAPDHEPYWFEAFGRVAITGESVRFENEARGLGNRWFDVNAFRVGAPELRQVGILFTDITQRKRLEKLQRDFVAMASHDLSAPISVLRVRAQLMRRRKAFDAEGIDIIIEQTRRMERLLSDMREAIRAETGWLGIQRTTVDLSEMAGEAAERARLLSKRHPIQADLPALPVVGQWDADRLDQIFDNLFGNAVKYSPPGEIITISVSADTDGEHARVSVSDHGEGIPAEALPWLFDRFYRGDRAGETPGLGLGLYIVRMIVEAHGGRVWAESEPGQGSTIVVSLPLAAHAAHVATESAHSHPD